MYMYMYVRVLCVETETERVHVVRKASTADVLIRFAREYDVMTTPSTALFRVLLSSKEAYWTDNLRLLV